MVVAYKYRLYPNKQQAADIDSMIDRHRWLYNQALAQRRDVWEQEQRTARISLREHLTLPKCSLGLG